MASRRPGIIRRLWNAVRRVFINPQTRQEISQAELLRVLEDRSNASKQLVLTAIEQAQAGDISFSQMQSVLNTEIRNINIQLYSFGRGGFAQVDEIDRQIMEGILTEEYTFSANFVTDIQSGKMTAAGVNNRFNKYIDHARQSFWEGSRESAKAAGFTQERRVLNPAEHCRDCKGYADQGWVGIGTLPRPGQASECRSNCKCSMEYRN